MRLLKEHNFNWGQKLLMEEVYPRISWGLRLSLMGGQLEAPLVFHLNSNLRFSITAYLKETLRLWPLLELKPLTITSALYTGG